jgi:putative ABC transport system permease protein
MQQWLNDYVYHTPLGISVLLAAIGFSTLIALLTIIWQSLRSAYANPIKSLRSE